MLASRLARLTAASAAAGLLLTSCLASPPDRADWRDETARAVGDVAGQLATVKLVLAQEQEGRLLPHYAVGVVVAAEEAAGSSADQVGSGQPPRSERARYDAVVAALEEAEGVLAAARIALADGDHAAYPELVEQLGRQGDRLARVETELGG